MEVKQIYTLVNTVTTEILGKSDLVAEDLSNVVDVGTEIFNNTDVDNYVKSLVNHIGRVIFVNRPYTGNIPSVLMDGWEFGSVLEKITAELPAATENESWDLVDGQSYDPNIFYKPTVSAKFFNKKVTFEIPLSFTEMQVKESFSSAEQLNGFLSMLYNAVEKSLTVKIDALIMRTIDNMIFETFDDEFGDDPITSGVRVKAVNLLYLYNGGDTGISAADALTTPEFLRFASLVMANYISRLTRISSIFNIGGKDRFTPPDMLHVVMLSDFKNAADIYLQSDTFHNELTALPKAETVPYWQGSGTEYDFASISSIKKLNSDNTTTTISGILAVMFDRDALGVTNLDRRVTTNYNPKAEFFTNWYKFDAGYFNDLNENFVVFYVA